MGCGVMSDPIKNVILPTNGQFEKKELIGVGSCGRVYRCIDPVSSQQFAMKVIDSKVNEKVIKREDESTKGLISRSRQLHKDLIASYYDIQWKQKEIMIIMELSKQGTLKKFIQQNGKLTEELVSKITAQILEGMCYLHNAGIIHRDLKSSNVLFFKEQQIKISDYGLEDLTKIIPTNKKQRSKGLDFSRGQSLRYSAPQIIKQEQTTYKSDIWSLGCIVIEMITGEAPWLNINSKFQSVFNSIIKQKAVVLPKDISQQCKSFLNKCLVVSPQKRATTYELFSHPFVRKFISKQGNNAILQSRDQVKKTLEKSDMPNRMTATKKDSIEYVKSPSSIERNIKKESPQSYRLYQNEKFDSQNKKQNEGDDHLNRLKQVVNNFGKIKKSKDKKALYTEDILPQILEDEQHMVMLNNKRVHIKNNPSKFKTQQNSTIVPRAQSQFLLEQNDSFLSINSNNNRYRIKSRPHSNFNDSLSNESRIKLETEPILMSNDMQKDPQYFKKPLKLIKRKLKEKKKIDNINYHSGNQISIIEENRDTEDLRLIEEQAMIYSSKIRTISQQSNEQVIIHTQLAKAERDRYIRQQLLMKKQKEQQKKEWENQLKKEAEVIKKQFAHRYAYKQFRPLII